MKSVRRWLAAVAAVAAVGAVGLAWGWREWPAETGAASRQALPDLLTQIYRAYALEDESAIYAALSSAVAGDVVTDLYLQRRRAQVADHGEDGQTQILSVEVYEATPLPGDDRFHAAWRVVGRVTHATHIHERINLYAADLSMTRMDDVWKLTDFVLTDATRDTGLNFEGGE